MKTDEDLRQMLSYFRELSIRKEIFAGYKDWTLNVNTAIVILKDVLEDDS